jgi:hypothetical protein
MKNTLKAVLIIVMLAAAPYAWSQANLKIGHIDSQALIDLMPQKDSVEAKLIAYQNLSKSRSVPCISNIRIK